MRIKISVPEVVNLIKAIQKEPARVFEMATMDVQKDVGKYLTNLMKAELTHLGAKNMNVQQEEQTTETATIHGTFV